MFDTTSKGNKNLWRSINTEKHRKKGSISENLSSPIFSQGKEGIFHIDNFELNSKAGEENRSDEKNSETNKENNDSDTVSKESEKSKIELSEGNSEEKTSSNEILIENELTISNNETNSRIRKIEIGEESVVEEIVDIKCTHESNLPEYPEEPMMLSFCSQTNILLRQLKLPRVKEEIERLYETQEELLFYVKQVSQTYFQEFEYIFNNTIAYILDYYSNKYENQHEQIHHFQHKIKESRSLDSTEDVFKNSIGLYRQSETDTARFPPETISSPTKKKISEISDFDERSEDILRLEEELFKVKTESKEKDERIEQLEEEKENFNELNFDYYQKLAQLELEINDKVESIVQQRLKSESKASAERLRTEYLYQIEELEEKVNNLTELSREKETTERENEEKEEALKFLQKSLNLKEIQLNNMQIALNELEVSYERKMESLEKRECELEEMYQQLEEREISLKAKEKQLLEIQTVKETQRIKTVPQNEFDLSKLTNIFHTKTPPYTSREHSPREYLSREYASKQNTLREVTRENKNARYGNSNILINPPWKPNHLNQFHQEPGYTSWHHSRNDSNEKEYSLKNKIIPNRKVLGVKSQANAYKNNTFTHSSSLMRNHDKNKIENLGNKLENLREQIKKEIRQAN